MTDVSTPPSKPLDDASLDPTFESATTGNDTGARGYDYLDRRNSGLA